jgi:sugar O-acyltransferase (sialic acid O-acetyltransferase NeuD family)
MINEVKIPKLDVNDEYAILTEWHVREGEYVEKGALLCSMETAKTVYDVTTEKSGFIKQLRYKAGDEVPMLEVVCFLVDSMDVEIPPAISAGKGMEKQDIAAPFAEKVTATAEAERVAQELGIDISQIRQKGVIRKKDVVRFHEHSSDSSKKAAILPAKERTEDKPPGDHLKRVAVYGAGAHGMLVKDLIDSLPDRQFYGFLDGKKPIGTAIGTGTVVGGRSFIKDLKDEGVDEIHVTVFDRHLREELSMECRENGLTLFTVVHPLATIADNIEIGEGCFIKAGAIIDSYSTVGEGTIIDNGCVIAHHCKIGRYCHLTPGVVTGGDVTIGDHTLVAIGASIMARVEIGDDCWVDVGSVVKSSFTGRGLFIGGQPAKIKAKEKAKLSGQ